MLTIKPPLFNEDEKVEYLDYLEKEGYVVIGNILPQDIQNDLIDKFWDAWTYVSPNFDKNNIDTWNIQNSPMMFAKGIAAFSGLSHSDFMWKLRIRPEIKEIFKTIHNTDELVVSFDGFSVFFDKKQKNSKPWWHIDQHPDNPLYCVQGAYNFKEVKEDSAGFILVPKSHKYMNVPRTAKGDWIMMDNDPIVNNGIKLLIPENSFVLWNSRLIHANTGMTCSEKRFDRLTYYITYLPKSSRSEIILHQRIQAYKNGDTTSHWANKCEVKKYPWGFGPQYEHKNFNKIIPEPDISEERLELF